MIWGLRPIARPGQALAAPLGARASVRTETQAPPAMAEQSQAAWGHEVAAGVRPEEGEAWNFQGSALARCLGHTPVFSRWEPWETNEQKKRPGLILSQETSGETRGHPAAAGHCAEDARSRDNAEGGDWRRAGRSPHLRVGRGGR